MLAGAARGSIAIGELVNRGPLLLLLACNCLHAPPAAALLSSASFFTDSDMAAPPKAIVAPSMLSSDFARLADEAKRMCSCGADWLHMDVMVRGR